MKNTEKLLSLCGICLLLATIAGFCSHSTATAASVADTKKATVISPDWEGENFIATIVIAAGPDMGNWQFTISPPFPHPLSGINDSYVQTALGMVLVRMEQPEEGTAWLLKAAMQNEMDAIMLLALHYVSENKTVEAERWLRKAVELGNLEAKAKLDDLLAGKVVKTSVTIANNYRVELAKQ